MRECYFCLKQLCKGDKFFNLTDIPDSKFCSMDCINDFLVSDDRVYKGKIDTELNNLHVESILLSDSEKSFKAQLASLFSFDKEFSTKNFNRAFEQATSGYTLNKLTVDCLELIILDITDNFIETTLKDYKDAGVNIKSINNGFVVAIATVI